MPAGQGTNYCTFSCWFACHMGFSPFRDNMRYTQTWQLMSSHSLPLPVCYGSHLGDWRCDWRSRFNQKGVCTGRVLQPEARELQMRSRAHIIHNGWERFTLQRRSEDLTPLGWACVCTPHARDKASWVETGEWTRRRNREVHKRNNSAAKWCDFWTTLIPAVADRLQKCWLSNVGSRWPSSAVMVAVWSTSTVTSSDQATGKKDTNELKFQVHGRWQENNLDWCWCYCVCLCPQISTSVQRAWLSATTTPAVSTCPAGITVNAEVVSMTMAPTCSMGAPALVSIHWMENILITAWKIPAPQPLHAHHLATMDFSPVSLSVFSYSGILNTVIA